MSFSTADYRAIKPFLRWSCPSFRVRANGSYTILGLIDGQQFIVEGNFEGRAPKAGLYCADAAKDREFKSSSAMPAPPEAHASYSARSVTDAAVFVLPDVENTDPNPSLAYLKKVFKFPNNTEVLLTPFDPRTKEGAEKKPSIDLGAYGDVQVWVEAECASGDTYRLNPKTIRCLPNDQYEVSITEQQIIIFESKKHGYYFLTGIEKVDPGNTDVLSKGAAVEKLVAAMKSFENQSEPRA